MKCNSRTMFSVAAGLLGAAAIAYFAVPAAQAFILASLPVLIALVCPLSMLVMMKVMHGAHQGTGGTAEAASDAAPAGQQQPGIAQGQAQR